MIQKDMNNDKECTTWLEYNLKYSKIGIYVAFGICGLNYFRDFELSWQTIFATFLFSITISLTITNIIHLSHRLFNRNHERTIKQVIVDFALMGLGIIIATEICFGVLYLGFDKWFTLQEQLPSLAFNLFAGFIIGGFRQIIDLQKENYEFKLKESEYQVTKLHELKTRAELEALQSKINPHFLYNSLNSIASLIHQDANKAEEMVLKLSKLFRYAINTNDESYTTLAYELDIVKTYLDIESIRLGDRLQTNFVIDETLRHEKIPRFLLQPLVENSIKHGISKITQNGAIEVGATSVNNEGLKIWVADNGPDFPLDWNPGYGLQNTFDKLKLLYNDNYELNIIMAPQKRIQIIIPKFVFKT
ncbi:hypothetical protein C3K47_01435 [Solitalea longa]|uniref:Signal transduction histidine kinase internal region domain-containing protein n=1 Tax=Solitalea longa TaxID=2079460 RepID=A0A2S5A9I7_9SPHI|nr:histidine kinase [Solitalea longa]POY39186.1 hypothetical protein C3K47_01435 [Solitalea longa]